MIPHCQTFTLPLYPTSVQHSNYCHLHRLHHHYDPYCLHCHWQGMTGLKIHLSHQHRLAQGLFGGFSLVCPSLVSDLLPNCNIHVKIGMYIGTFWCSVDIILDVRVRGLGCCQSKQQMLVSDLGNSKLQSALTTFLRHSPCFLTPTSSLAVLALAPTTPSFLQPLMRLLICLMAFMMGSTATSSK